MRALLLVPLLLAGCLSASNIGNIGVSPGGNQDIGTARQLIESGYIPDQEHFTAEGLFSEIDLPLDGPACDATLCPRAAVAWMDPVDGSDPGYLAQIGFASSVALDSFQRRPQHIAVCIDTSGSMSGESRLGLVQTAVDAMIDQLNADDQVTLVTYGSRPRVIQPLIAMDAAGRQRLREQVAALDTDGSTNMESGMRTAYDALTRVAPPVGTEQRLMLFTDAQPNTGATGVDSFLGLVHAHADEGVGITVLGVGLDFGTELGEALATTRGGNAYTLYDHDTARALFSESFAFMVTALAYDLWVAVAPTDGVRIGAGVGMPVDGPESAFGASTLFASRHDGGLGLTLFGEPARGALATLEMTYTDVADEEHHETLAVIYEGGVAYSGAGGRADDLGVYKMNALFDVYRGLLFAADWCDGRDDDDETQAVLADAAARALGVADETADEHLGEIGQLLQILGENVAAGRDRCAASDAYLY